MTVRPRYTYRRKARHLAKLSGMVWASVQPVLEVAVRTARMILTRRYIDPQEKP